MEQSPYSKVNSDSGPQEIPLLPLEKMRICHCFHKSPPLILSWVQWIPLNPTSIFLRSSDIVLPSTRNFLHVFRPKSFVYLLSLTCVSHVPWTDLPDDMWRKVKVIFSVSCRFLLSCSQHHILRHPQYVSLKACDIGLLFEWCKFWTFFTVSLVKTQRF